MQKLPKSTTMLMKCSRDYTVDAGVDFDVLCHRLEGLHMSIEFDISTCSKDVFLKVLKD